MKVSIVMPVYNGERFLREAIDSILSQEESSWELIVVDDGSTDSTPRMLDEYASNDARIRVFHRENHGVAASRQFGIERAQGEYCIHVDADDWAEPDYLSSLLAKAEESEADMVWCDLYVDRNSVWRQECIPSPEAMIRSFLTQRTWGFITNRLTKTVIYQNPEVRFVPECSMWEDMSFLVQCLCFCEKVSYLAKPLYHYRTNENSLTHTQSLKDISAEYRKAIDFMEDFLIRHGQIEKYAYELRGLKLFAIRDFIDDLRFRDYERFLNTYPDAIAHIGEYKQYPNRLKVCAWLLQHGLNCLVPFVCRVDTGLRRLGLSKQM